MLQTNQLYCMDAIEFMKQVDNKVVDLILTDLPYGTTACEWDNVIPLDKLWQQFKRIIKDKGMVVLTASQPFTTDLINSNRKWFRYCLVWEKNTSSSFLFYNKMPLKYHEDICVFYKNNPTYNPQMIKRTSKSSQKRYKYHLISQGGGKHFPNLDKIDAKYDELLKYPSSILKFDSTPIYNGKYHPTEKHIELFRYLIKTYTNKGDLVLDCCVGSGTTAIACKQTDRRFLCNDNNPQYIEISNQRLKQTNLNAFSDTTETLNESPSIDTDLTLCVSELPPLEEGDFP